MASFETFNGDHYAVDDTKKSITKKKAGLDYYQTAYGRTPMICDEANRGVYQFELKIIKMRVNDNILIGIDEGRQNMDQNTRLWDASTSHYVLRANGQHHVKGTTFLFKSCNILIQSKQ